MSCFGGAGGQHACLVADALGIETVLVHPLAGVLSAYGMGLADRRAVREATAGLPLAGCADALAVLAARLEADARGELTAQGVDPEEVGTAGEAHIRLAAGESTIPVALGSEAEMRAAFAAAHRSRFGYASDAALTIDMVRIEAAARGAHDLPAFDPAATAGAPVVEVAAYMAGETRAAPVFARAELAAGQAIAGPALVIDPVATLAVEPGWTARMEAGGMLVLRRTVARRGAAAGTEVDPVRLEIFGGLFMGIAEEMGGALRHSASSVNIRERLDFSCAVFDHEGSLIANAPHMPGAPRFDGRQRADDHRGPRGRDAAGRCLRSQRALCGRHPPARHHGDRAGVRGGRRRARVLRRRARAPRRHRRHRARIDAVELDEHRGRGRAPRRRADRAWRTALRGRAARAACRGTAPGAQPCD